MNERKFNPLFDFPSKKEVPELLSIIIGLLLFGFLIWIASNTTITSFGDIETEQYCGPGGSPC